MIESPQNCRACHISVCSKGPVTRVGPGARWASCLAQAMLLSEFDANCFGSQLEMLWLLTFLCVQDLCLEQQYSFVNDFGAQLEVSAHSTFSKGQKSVCDMERMVLFFLALSIPVAWLDQNQVLHAFCQQHCMVINALCHCTQRQTALCLSKYPSVHSGDCAVWICVNKWVIGLLCIAQPVAQCMSQTQPALVTRSGHALLPPYVPIKHARMQ